MTFTLVVSNRSDFISIADFSDSKENYVFRLRYLSSVDELFYYNLESGANSN